MPKFIGNKVVKFVGYRDKDGNVISDWHDEYLNCAGLLCVYESEHKYPGKKFAYFYPNEPDDLMQRYFTVISAIYTENDNRLSLETEVGRFDFEAGEFISDPDLELLFLNVMMHPD